MDFQPKGKICLTPELHGVGGMVSFQHKLAAGLIARGIEVTKDMRHGPLAAVLVIGGTRQIGQLLEVKQKGIRIVQRLDGMNWLHRRMRTGTRHYLRATYGNLLLELIRTRLADRIVYQSKFAQEWWEKENGSARADSKVIYNGVNLKTFSPGGMPNLPEDRVRILMVEGSLMGGYEIGLESAAKMVVGLKERLINSHSHTGNKPAELMIVGQVSESVRNRWSQWLDKQTIAQDVTLSWAGLIPHEQIPVIDRSAHLLYSSDLNAACPNSAIESMACGTPVVAFDTGALPELLDGEGGRVASYGGNPWMLEQPDISALIEAACEVLENLDAYRISARNRAKALFDVEFMVDRYLDFLLEG